MNDTSLRVALAGYGLAGAVFHAPLIAATPGLKLDTVVIRGVNDQEIHALQLAKLAKDCGAFVNLIPLHPGGARGFRPTPPEEIVLDIDATDDPLHGHQEGRFFHGYDDCYCYLPLYVFCGRHLLAAKLRPANIDAAAGAMEEIARIVTQIRARWPHTRIILRADSGFAREALMGWCEANAVDYIFGLARNARLKGTIAAELGEAQQESQQTGKPARRFKDFTWSTLKSWSRERRVIAKAEWTRGEENPRFIVTTLTKGDGRHLYEDIYCARGEMENRIKECQIDLFADRTSTATMAANQLRLWFASMAYVLIEGTRRLALQATDLADATCGTIRRKLFKIGALVTISVRRIKFAMASGCPYKTVFATAHRALDTT